MLTGSAAWVQLIILWVFLVDLFAIYITTFNAPLGIKSVAFEKWVLSAIHVMDLIFDFGVIAMFIFAGVQFNEDTFLIAMFVIALPVLAANYLSLYYTFFEYEKDHSLDYDIDDEDRYI